MEIKMRVWQFEFKNLSDLSVGGITFQVSGDESQLMVDMTVPVDPSARWFSDLKIDEIKIQKFFDMAEQQGLGTGIPPVFAIKERVPQVGTIVEFPGEVTSRRLNSTAGPALAQLSVGGGTDPEKKGSSGISGEWFRGMPEIHHGRIRDTEVLGVPQC
jgi:hypothetical protein